LFLVVASVVKCKYKFNGGEKGNALHPEKGAKKRGEQGVGVKYLFVAEHKFYAAYFHAPLRQKQHNVAQVTRTQDPGTRTQENGSEAHKTFRCHSSGKV